MRLPRWSWLTILLIAIAAAAPFVFHHFRHADQTCPPLSNDARSVAFTRVPGTLPPMTGGAIPDGVYEATRAEGYGGATASGRRMTLAIRNGATRFSWSGDVLDETGSIATAAAVRVDANVAVSGNQLRVTVTCSSVSPPPLPATMMFRVLTGKIQLALVDGANAFVTTYSRLADP